MCGFLVAISRKNLKFNHPSKDLEESIKKQLIERSDSKYTINKSFSEDDGIYSLHGHLSISNQSEYIKYPISGEDSKLIFNGEIYSINKKKFKDSNYFSDGHMLLDYLDNEFKIEDPLEKFIKSVSGQYGLVYIINDTVLISRDIFGQKPIYKYIDDNYIIIASTENIILTYLLGTNFSKGKRSLPNIKNEIENFYGLSNYIGIEKLLPGSVEIYTTHKNIRMIKSYCIFKSKFFYEDKSLIFKSNDDIEKSFIEAMECVIPKDDYSLALSSGFDSNNVLFAVYKNRLKKPKKILTINSENNSKEIEHCQKVCKFLNRKLDVINPKFTTERNLFTKINYDNANACINALTYECLKSNLKILLTGDGGDEISFRYRRSIYINLINRLPIELKQFISPLLCLGKMNFSTSIAFKAYQRNIFSRINYIYDLIRINDSDIVIKNLSTLPHIYELYLHLPEHILNKSDIISYLNKTEIRSPYLTNEFGLRGLFSNFSNIKKAKNYSKILNKIIVPKEFQTKRKHGLSA